MTLKEKFKERLYNQSHDDSECLRIKFENIDKVIDSQEKIADYFALEFADWIRYNVVEVYKGWQFHGKFYEDAQLLEIFKKEKGL